MSELITQILPLALGSAISPTMLAVVLLILSGADHPRARGAFFALGGTAMLVILGAIVLSLGSKTVHSGKHPDTTAAVVDLVLGVLLLVGSARQLRHKRPTRQRKPHPRSPGTHAGHFFAFGFLIMMVNFSTTVLYADAVKEVAHASVSEVSRALVVAMLIAFATLPAFAPVIAYAIAPRPAAHALSNLNVFVTRHARAIGAGICLVFGAYLVIKGAKAL